MQGEPGQDPGGCGGAGGDSADRIRVGKRPGSIAPPGPPAAFPQSDEGGQPRFPEQQLSLPQPLLELHRRVEPHDLDLLMGRPRAYYPAAPLVESHWRPRKVVVQYARGSLEVQAFRRKHGMTVVDLARLAKLSAGMLSKIENGLTSPSLATLRALSTALGVPVTAFFRRFEEHTDATFVRAGEGLVIERRGTRVGHQYRLLGHGVRKSVVVEPYLITLTEESEVFPLFQHDSVEFLYVLEGRMRYRHGDKTYLLGPGDSLFFDANAPHGPDELIALPIRFLAVISQAPGAEG